MASGRVNAKLCGMKHAFIFNDVLKQGVNNAPKRFITGKYGLFILSRGAF